MAQFTEALGLEGVTLVVQDWGGPIGLGALAARPALARRVVAANTALHTAEASLAGRLAWPVHDNGDGSVTVDQMLLDYQRLTQELDAVPTQPLRAGRDHDRTSPEPVLAAYDAPFPDDSFAAGPRRLPAADGDDAAAASAPASTGTASTRCRRRVVPVLTAFSDGDPGTAGWAEVLAEWIPGAAGQAHVTIARSRALPPRGPGPGAGRRRGPAFADGGAD